MKGNSSRNVSIRYLEKIFAIMVIASSLPCLAVSDNNTGQQRRLAILSSEDVQKSGLSDLVALQVQELSNVEIVERDLLRQVMNEVALSIMLGAEQAEIITGSAERLLNQPPQSPWDIVFFDPPFADSSALALLAQLQQPGYLSDSGLIYLERPRREPLPFENQLIKRGRAGDCHFGLLAKAGA